MKSAYETVLSEIEKLRLQITTFIESQPCANLEPRNANSSLAQSPLPLSLSIYLYISSEFHAYQSSQLFFF